MRDQVVKDFLISRGIKLLEFQPYPAGASKLGGCVEALVKQTKKIVTSSIGRNILFLKDFELLIRETQMLINKRPIGFKDNLVKLDQELLPIGALTPEMIIYGREIPCLNIMPGVESEFKDGDFNLNTDELINIFRSLNKVRHKLLSLYQNEFVATLLHQSCDRKGRYKPVSHFQLLPGDLVSIRKSQCKPYNYPLAIVIRTELNDLGEVVAATVRKANYEVVRRHSSDLIFLLRPNDGVKISSNNDLVENSIPQKSRPERRAAKKCLEHNRKLIVSQAV